MPCATIALRTQCALATFFLLTAAMLAQSPLGTAFTYQGQLKQSGSPASGSFSMTFKLFDDATAGNQIGPALTFDGAGGDPPPVGVNNGLFTIQLDFGSVLDGNNRWLEIAVSGTTLSPRQPLTAAPYASFSTAPWATSGTTISNTNGGNVGVGTNTPESSLHVFKGSAGSITANPNAVIAAENNANCYFNILAPDSSESGVLFGRPGSSAPSAAGGIVFNNGLDLDGLLFRTGGNSNRMALTGGGNLGIGTTSPAALLHVASGSAGISPNSNSLLVVERNTSTFINVLCPASQQLGILFGTPTNNADGGIVYNSSGARGMQFRTGGNSTRVTIDSFGNVGIGNAVPLNALSVAGAVDVSGSLGLGTTTPASKLEIVPATDGDGIRLTGSTSPIHSPVVSLNDGPTQRCMMGLAEAAAEFSTDALLGDMVLRSNATKLLLQTGTGASGIAIVNNNIGMGTISPAAKLDVRGDVRLATNGDLFAPGGVENLRVLRGRVVGSTGNVPEGSGFTATHPATGQWTVTFTTAFPSPPSISATAFRTGAAAILTVNSFTASSVEIRIYTTAGAAVDADFFLIVAGPR